MNQLFTRIGTLVAGGIAVVVFGGAVIGTSYSGVILTHIADVVNGSNTAVVVATNAPNWAMGTPIATPIALSVASSSYPNASSGLASSTTFFFAVSALDGQGTTTMSNVLSFTTDAKGTQPKPEIINVKWNRVSGATGYALYFGNSATALSKYWIATTTDRFYFATSSAAKTGSYTKTDTTAFSTLISPVGPSILRSAVTTATSTLIASSTVLEIGGNLRAQSQATTTNCYAALNGSMFYNKKNSHLWVCLGAGPTWTLIK